MPLRNDEIQPGIVAIFDGKVLQSDPNVTSPDHDGIVRSGPFLCIRVKDGVSVWLHLTRQPKGKLRLELDKSWRVDGSPDWQQTEASYINDARKPFTAPNASFVAASQGEIEFTWHARPKISSVGVEAAIKEVAKYGVVLL